MRAWLWASTDNGHPRANEEVLVLLTHKMRVEFLKRGVLRLISDCTVDPVSAILVFALASEFDWAGLYCPDGSYTTLPTQPSSLFSNGRPEV